jgi:hypothetical protein
MRRAHLFLSDIENRRLLACLFGAILALIVFRFWSP